MSSNQLINVVNQKIQEIEAEQRQLESQTGQYYGSATYQQNVGQVRALSYIKGHLMQLRNRAGVHAA